MKRSVPLQTITVQSSPAPRRVFLRQVCATALVGATGLGSAACSSTATGGGELAGVEFLHGVASGDPLDDRVILWTRVTPQSPRAVNDIAVHWQVASDAQMRQLVASGSSVAAADADYTVKIDCSGLLPGHSYFYRFTAQGAQSPIGRTRTLPKADADAVRLAVFCCSNYPAGYFNVYADAAKRNDFDAALHIGDYIYEYESTGYACGDAVALGRLSEPRNLLVVLNDYRRRYAQYRTDPDLQALHASVPMIAVWDDHEFADDAWRDGSADHDATKIGPFSLRKRAAMNAYHEWMPIRAPDPDNRERIYRSFDFGKLVSLHMLDTRLIGRDQQLMMSSYFDAAGKFDDAKYRRDLASPQRQMMGLEQMQWLERQVAQSRARWQILGQQVLMARMEYPLPVAFEEISGAEYVALKNRGSLDPASLSSRERACLAAPTLPCYLDSWDGYPHNRELVFQMMQRYRKNLVVLAGDSHNAWASDLHDDAGRQVGVEFATTSVSSPGLECSHPGKNPDDIASMMEQMIAPLYYAQTSKRGYLIVTATDDEVRCDFRFVDTVHSHQYTASTERSVRTLAGPGNRKLVEC
jgi:alkaline phosphatase D